jgi:alkylhydroperoxidase family enzyme
LILRVAWQCRADYEWWHHVPLALRAGLRPEEIAAAAGVPSAADPSERRRVLIAITDDVLARQTLSDGTWQAARQTLTEREMIEACLLIGHYQGLASVIGGLGIQLEGGSLNEAPVSGGPAAPRSSG